jgi:hypothetical protein
MSGREPTDLAVGNKILRLDRNHACDCLLGRKPTYGLGRYMVNMLLELFVSTEQAQEFL